MVLQTTTNALVTNYDWVLLDRLKQLYRKVKAELIWLEHSLMIQKIKKMYNRGFDAKDIFKHEIIYA